MYGKTNAMTRSSGGSGGSDAVAAVSVRTSLQPDVLGGNYTFMAGQIGQLGAGSGLSPTHYSRNGSYYYCLFLLPTTESMVISVFRGTQLVTLKPISNLPEGGTVEYAI